MTTVINWNGSKWAGEEPDSLDVLFARLATATLDPSLAPFHAPSPRIPCATCFFGNFVDVSSAFSVDTDEPEVAERFVALIRENVSTMAYRDAMSAQVVYDREKQARAERAGRDRR